MILQEKNYIKKQKKKYLIHSCIWTVVVFVLFGVGLLLTGTRSNYFTISACVMAIVAALFISRFISFSRFKDGDETRACLLEAMKGNYQIFHSGIIIDASGTSYFEHIVLTSKSIYLIAYDEAKMKKYQLWAEKCLINKGIPTKSIHFLVALNEISMKNIAHRIEKDACVTNEKLEEYSKILNEILM